MIKLFVSCRVCGSQEDGWANTIVKVGKFPSSELDIQSVTELVKYALARSGTVHGIIEAVVIINMINLGEVKNTAKFAGGNMGVV